jgi:septum formation protein
MRSHRHLVLASGSPRRRALLEAAGFTFSIAVSDVDESPRRGELPVDMVCRLARAKALEATSGHVTIAADTIVVLDGQILGKPVDAEDAGQMLATIAGATHEVVTGFCVSSGGSAHVEAVTTTVTMTPMTPAQISEYVATGEPMDKAGSYAYQGVGRRYVSAVTGSRTNVIGLPLETVIPVLGAFGVHPDTPVEIDAVERSILS